jgi:hypothetical protein
MSRNVISSASWASYIRATSTGAARRLREPGQGSADLDRAGVEGPAHDRTRQSPVRQTRGLLDVVHRADTAGQDHRDPDCSGQLRRGFEVRTGQHAVPGDVGVDDRRNAGVLEAASHVDRVGLALLEPALHRDPTVPGVDAHDDATGKARRGIADECRVA